MENASLGRDGQCWPIPQLPSVPPPTHLHLHLPFYAYTCKYLLLLSLSFFPCFLVIRHSFYPLHSSLPSSNPSKPPSSFLDTRKEGKDYHHPLPRNVDNSPDAKSPGYGICCSRAVPIGQPQQQNRIRTESGADPTRLWTSENCRQDQLGFEQA